MRKALLLACLLPACEGGTAQPVGDSLRTAPYTDLPAFFDCLRENEITLVSAHRATDGTAPENALRSIQDVVVRTGGLVEVDVATSTDGVLFLHHDDDLDRTTTGRGSAELSWSALRELSLRDAGGRVTPLPLTRLDDLLAWSEGRALVQLDVKRGTDYRDVAAVLKEAGAQDSVVVIAYSVGQAAAIARAMPEVMISATIERASDLDDLQRRGVSLDHVVAWTGNERPDPTLWDALDRAGVEVIFGTLGGRDSLDASIERAGDDEAYAELARDGISIIATDRPVQAAAALQKAGRADAASVCIPRSPRSGR